MTDFHAKVAERAIRTNAPPANAPAAAVIFGDTPLVWPVCKAPAAVAVHQLGRWFTELLQAWPPQITGGDATELRWTTWVHLLVDFMMATGTRPPTYRHERWDNPADGPSAGMTPWAMSTQARWFARQIRCLTRHSNVAFQTTATRPDSIALQVWMTAVGVAYPKQCHDVVEAWLHNKLHGVCRRHCRAWTSLPRPTFCPEMHT